MCSELENMTYIQMVEQISYHARRLKDLPIECQSYITNNLTKLGVTIENFEDDLLLYYTEFEDEHWQESMVK